MIKSELNVPKVPFDIQTYLEILRIIRNAPRGSRQIDDYILDKIEDYLAAPARERTTVSLWNFYKEMLDWIVYTGGASGFFIKLFDLEPFVEAPEGPGVYKHSDQSIDQAPWRNSILGRDLPPSDEVTSEMTNAMIEEDP